MPDNYTHPNYISGLWEKAYAEVLLLWNATLNGGAGAMTPGTTVTSGSHYLSETSCMYQGMAVDLSTVQDPKRFAHSKCPLTLNLHWRRRAQPRWCRSSSTLPLIP